MGGHNSRVSTLAAKFTPLRYFRLQSRRLLNGLQFFKGPWFFVAALFLAPPTLIMPWFDSLDRDRNFTLGYICSAKKS